MDPVDEQANQAGVEARTYWKQRQVADVIIPMANTYGRPQPGRSVELAEFERHRKQAADWGRRVLGSMRVLERYADVDGKLVTRYELDSRHYIAALLGKLTGVYFGVEDPIDYKLASWSREVSLHVFRECPVQHARSEAVAAGVGFRGYVEELVSLVRSGGLGQTVFNNRLRAVIAAFDHVQDEQGARAFADDHELVSTLVGIVSGALATTASLFFQGLAAYAKQQNRSSFELPAQEPGPALTAAMQDKGLSVPDRIYRVCRNDTEVDGVAIAAGTLVVLGQGSALRENRARPADITFFGHGRHHCPAERLALAMIDGAALALAEQGTLTVLDADAYTFSVSL
jgi:cytochrome P450